ncbi:MAG TPA: hypothetical protein VM532_12740 [Burkholderiales bacterium]|nr:hypothetical protein [Burkholderiales bacterium]
MNTIEHLLTCAAEEAVEVAQRADKAARFGLTETQPGQTLTNAARIMGELVELLAVIEMLEERGLIQWPKPEVIREMKDQKKGRVIYYMDYARRLGTLRDE